MDFLRSMNYEITIFFLTSWECCGLFVFSRSLPCYKPLLWICNLLPLLVFQNGILWRCQSISHSTKCPPRLVRFHRLKLHRYSCAVRRDLPLLLHWRSCWRGCRCGQQKGQVQWWQHQLRSAWGRKLSCCQLSHGSGEECLRYRKTTILCILTSAGSTVGHSSLWSLQSDMPSQRQADGIQRPLKNC